MRSTELIFRRIAGRVLWVAWLVLIALATLTPSGEESIPGALCLVCGEVGGTDVVLNVLLYFPLGLGLAVDRIRAEWALPSMLALTVSVEALQWVAIPGRDGTLGDVVTNCIGGVLGFLVGRHLGGILFPRPSVAARLAAAWFGVWLTLQVVTSFAFSVRPTDGQYYGQLTRPLGSEMPYPGRVLRASVAGFALPDVEMADSRAVSAALAQPGGATVDVRLESRAQSPRFAPIARVLDEQHREEVMLAAERGSLLFSVRTGAADLRLRPVVVRLRNAFGSSDATAAPRDSQELRVLYAPPVAVLSASGRRGLHARVLRVTPAAGWRLIAPVDTWNDGSASGDALDAGWLLIVLAPAGYWLGWLIRGQRRRGHAGLGLPVVIVSAMVVVVGLAIGPLWFEMAFPAWWEVTGAGLGLLAGVLVAGVLRRAYVGGRDQHLDDSPDALPQFAEGP